LLQSCSAFAFSGLVQSNQLLGFVIVLGDFEAVAEPKEERSVGKFLLSLWKEITR
ncbi:hypothetical protein KI387_032723, partial [Taxus chinensis]